MERKDEWTVVVASYLSKRHADRQRDKINEHLLVAVEWEDNWEHF